jgi:hypothetical protein
MSRSGFTEPEDSSAASRPTTSRKFRIGAGAYGLRLEGVDAAAELLVPADGAWPTLALAAEVGPAAPVHQLVDDERAVLATRSGTRLEITRSPLRAVFTAPQPISEDALVHPHLASAAAVASRWLGRESLHAGAFVAGGRAWAVLGDRGSGKSSLLAALALASHPVLADDLLVLEGPLALAGPRGIDLRKDAAERLGAGEPLGVVGTRERWRVRIGPAPVETELAGLILLAWGDVVGLAPVGPGSVLEAVVGAQALRVPPEDPASRLSLAALPGWELTRPPDWASLPAALERLLALAG